MDGAGEPHRSAVHEWLLPDDPPWAMGQQLVQADCKASEDGDPEHDDPGHHADSNITTSNPHKMPNTTLQLALPPDRAAPLQSIEIACSKPSTSSNSQLTGSETHDEGDDSFRTIGTYPVVNPSDRRVSFALHVGGGHTCMMQWRAKNSNGFSEWSQASLVRPPAIPPKAPAAPLIRAASSSTIELLVRSAATEGSTSTDEIAPSGCAIFAIDAREVDRVEVTALLGLDNTVDDAAFREALKSYNGVVESDGSIWLPVKNHGISEMALAPRDWTCVHRGPSLLGRISGSSDSSADTLAFGIRPEAQFIAVAVFLSDAGESDLGPSSLVRVPAALPTAPRSITHSEGSRMGTDPVHSKGICVQW